MRPRRYSDAGQAFPIYITVVAGLLFLAFAYVAVGQAAVNRGGTQTAADAAALAAAQDTRDQLAGKWVENVLDPTKWQDIFDGIVDGTRPSCGRADQLAGQNDAHMTASGCQQTGPLSYTVSGRDQQVGRRLDRPRHGEQVLESPCHRRDRAALHVPTPGADAGDDVLPKLTCKDRDWDLDPLGSHRSSRTRGPLRRPSGRLTSERRVMKEAES
jgi:hypothetical protein